MRRRSAREIGFDRARIRGDRLGPPFAQHAACRHHEHMVAQPRHHLHVVLDHQHRRAFEPVDLGDARDDDLKQRRIDAGGRLIQQQHLRLRHESAGDFEELALAARRSTRAG